MSKKIYIIYDMITIAKILPNVFFNKISFIRHLDYLGDIQACLSLCFAKYSLDIRRITSMNLKQQSKNFMQSWLILSYDKQSNSCWDNEQQHNVLFQWNNNREWLRLLPIVKNKTLVNTRIVPLPTRRFSDVNISQFSDQHHCKLSLRWDFFALCPG